MALIVAGFTVFESSCETVRHSSLNSHTVRCLTRLTPKLQHVRRC